VTFIGANDLRPREHVRPALVLHARSKLCVPTIRFSLGIGAKVHVPPHQSSSILQTTAVTGIGFWVAGGARAQESKSPNEKVAMASIGLGGKGSSDSGDAGTSATWLPSATWTKAP